MDLINEQMQFASCITPSGRPDAHTPPHFITGHVSPERGLAVYQNNLRLAWRNALAATFPVMVQLLGEQGFSLSARDYMLAHPSQSGDLNELGQNFASFMAQYPALYEYPYLSDVARLEWFWHQSHYAANHSLLRVENLVQQGADEWLAAQVRFASSAYLYQANHAAASIWLAHQASGDLSVLDNDALIIKTEYALISRPMWRVQVRLLDESAFIFLSTLQAGASFKEAFLAVENANLSLDFVALLPVLIEAGAWSDLIWTLSPS